MIGQVRRLFLPARRRVTMNPCFSSCEAEGRFAGSRIIHARTKLRANAENLLGNSGIGFESDPMQKIAAVGAISALKVKQHKSAVAYDDSRRCLTMNIRGAIKKFCNSL